MLYSNNLFVEQEDKYSLAFGVYMFNTRWSYGFGVYNYVGSIGREANPSFAEQLLEGEM